MSVRVCPGIITKNREKLSSDRQLFSSTVNSDRLHRNYKCETFLIFVCIQYK